MSTSSSSVQADPKQRAPRLRGLLILLLVVAYPAAAWWLLHRGGQVAEAALWAAALPQAFCYAILLWLFGRSLRPHREALITRFARFIHGDIPPAVARYTRQLTVFWCVFFAAMAVISVGLLLFVSAAAWLFFANVLNLPLLAATFTGEYWYRSIRFPDARYPSLVATITAFRRFREGSK